MKCSRCGEIASNPLRLKCRCGHDFRGPPAQSSEIIELLFSVEGRISRSAWWKGTLSVYALTGFAAFIIIRLLSQPVIYWVFVFPVAFWMFLALAIKRWADINRPARWAILNFIPGVALVAFIVNGFVRGDDGVNSYGPDPIKSKVGANSRPEISTSTAGREK